MRFIRKIWFWRNETFAYRVVFRKTKRNLTNCLNKKNSISKYLKTFLFCWYLKQKRNETKFFLRGGGKTRCSITKKTKRWHPYSPESGPDPYWTWRYQLFCYKEETDSAIYILVQYVTRRDWRSGIKIILLNLQSSNNYCFINLLGI